jgi:4-hydroxy-4-methyl-2-oxoglutarate aldolase
MTIMETNRPFTGAELDKLAAVLRTALVSDILDGLGMRGQCVAPGIAPLAADTVAVGFAYPTVAEPVDAVPDEPYVGLLAALDAVSADDIWVVSSTSDAALWGELTSTAVQAQGVRGTVVDGYVRDTRMVRALGYPVFSRGTSPRDANGRVEIRPHPGPVQLGGVSVSAGDLVVCDDDGVVIVPARLIAEVVAAALEKSSNESLFRAAVEQGTKPSAAYQRYHVL